MARVTLATIATATGLSKFAVSRALAGKNGVSEETRRRVEAKANELGYARTTPVVEAPTLGVIFHDVDLINSELHLLMQSGVQAEAQRRGYQVKMRWTYTPDQIEALARECDGLALVGPMDREGVERARAVGIPIVRNGWLDPLEQMDLIHGSDHESGSAVAHFLLNLGHRSIAYVHGAPGFRGRIERFYGLREVLETRGDVDFREMKFQRDVRFTDHLLAAQQAGFRPTAFFCSHDGLAVTVLSELLRLGYKIPDDATVIGFGDYSAATQISPQLTTVKTQGQQIGAGLVRLLDDRIHARLPPDIPLRVFITGHIVERDSSGPVKRELPLTA